MAFGNVRLWDAGTRWADIAPKAGIWNFDRMGTFVHTANQHGAEVLYTLGSTPQWASERPDEPCPYGKGCGAEPVRMAHWEEYVRRVAQRYGNRISAYELWNEPNFLDFSRDVGKPGFYTGSVANMVEMARIARQVLDTAAPSARLCTPGFVNGPDRLDKFLADGGAQYVQAVCYHFYAEGSEHFIKQVNEVRAIMKRNGVAHLPLWNTETGVDTLVPGDPPSGIAALSREEAVARLSQMLILGAASGIDRFYYYAWDNTRSGMVSPEGRTLAGHDAILKLQSWLLGAQFKGCHSANQLILCEALKAKKKYAFVWTSKPTPNTETLPVGLQGAVEESLFGDMSQYTVDSVPIRLELVQSKP